MNTNEYFIILYTASRSCVQCNVITRILVYYDDDFNGFRILRRRESSCRFPVIPIISRDLTRDDTEGGSQDVL